MAPTHRQRGFTLVEMIVALMIFSIVAVVALAALVKVIDANKKAQTTQDAVIGLSFALESMSRELRTGSKIHCEAMNGGAFDPTTMAANSCSVGHNQLIAFMSTKAYPAASPTCHLAYAYLVTGTGPYVLEKAEQPDCAHVFSSDDFAPIVPGTTVMTDYKLGVTYNAATQPFPEVFLELTGYAGSVEKNKTYFNVETASSPRTP